MKDEIIEIAKSYGRKAQVLQTQEECAELIVAISKWNRTGDTANLIEEIADVEIMLEQLKFLFDCKADIEVVKERKISRTLCRLRN